MAYITVLIVLYNVTYPDFSGAWEKCMSGAEAAPVGFEALNWAVPRGICGFESTAYYVTLLVSPLIIIGLPLAIYDRFTKKKKRHQ